MITLIRDIFTVQEIAPLSAKLMVREFRAQLGNKMRKDCILQLSDPFYTPIPESKVSDIYIKSSLKNKKYIPNLFDCENFAKAFTSEVEEYARKSRKTKYQYAFGIVYGDIPTPHAINWFFTPEEKIMFMEPQSGEIFHPKGNNIVFLFS